MIKLEDMCICSDAILRDALVKIDKNAQGLLFVVVERKLLGVITDGDIRRSILSGKTIEDKITTIYNENCVYLPKSASLKKIQDTINEKIKVIPLVDGDGNIVDFASVSRLNRIPVLEPLLGGNELEYVSECVKTNWISSQGAFVGKFENHVREYTGSKYVLAVSNGTVALSLALSALNIGPGDKVIVPNLTFGASVNSIISVGAIPIIVDVDIDDWNISLDKIRDAIELGATAIMPVHIYGNPCKMHEIVELAKKNDLFVIEDCAEALGSSINGQHVGTFGDAGTFSFFGNKVITCGEGGAIIFKSKSTYEKAKILRDHGMEPGRRYYHLYPGYNYRITNLQAAIGCAQFEQLDLFQKKRKEIYSWYNEFLSEKDYFDYQVVDSKSEVSYWLYTIKFKNELDVCRNEVVSRLSNFGIDTRPMFFPMDEMPAFKSFEHFLNGNTKAISFKSISLPTSVYLTRNDVYYIVGKFFEVIDSILESKFAER